MPPSGRGRRGPAANPFVEGFGSFWEAARASSHPPCVAGSGPEGPVDELTIGIPVARVRLLRKEVIQPQVPLRLPCYDFIPITTHTLDGSPLADGPPASGADGFHDVTGGVYKARERIHGTNC